MASTEKPQHMKAIGWYALQRVRIQDWLKPHHSKQSGKAESLESFIQTSQKDQAKESEKSEQSQSSDKDSQKIAAKQTEGASDQSNEDKQHEKIMQKPSSDSTDAMKLQAVVRESHTILAKAHSVFPFQLFPDTVNIDRHKLTIVRRQFFGIEQKVSVPLENVKNIEADLGPFFGSITVTSDLFINNTQEVHFLWRDDAKKIQKLVQGAVVAQTQGIDLNKIEVKQLRNMLIDLGSGHTKSM